MEDLIMAVPDLQNMQKVMDTPTLRDDSGLMAALKNNSPMSPKQILPDENPNNIPVGQPPPIPVPIPMPPQQQPLRSIKDYLDQKGIVRGQEKTTREVVLDNLVERALPTEVQELNEQPDLVAKTQIQPSNPLQEIINMDRLSETNPEESQAIAAARGGLIKLAMGGEFSGRVEGQGHGMEDNVRMPIIDNNKEVGTLAVSPTEYVVDSYTMAALGNGNPDAGADIMDETIEDIREEAYGTKEQPNEIDGLASLRPLIERV
jgi:hypothetical protein